MNTKMKVLLAGILGMSLVAAPILTNAASASSVQAVSSATSKQVPTPTTSTTAPSTTKMPQATPVVKSPTTNGAKAEVWTIEKVKAYTGKSGNLAYIVVSGVIYDVTNVPNWKNGSHNGLSAGADLTTAFSKSPHSAKLLQQLKIVAKIGDPMITAGTKSNGTNNATVTSVKAEVPGTNPLKASALKDESKKHSDAYDDDFDDENEDDNDEDEDENEHEENH